MRATERPGGTEQPDRGILAGHQFEHFLRPCRSQTIPFIRPRERDATHEQLRTRILCKHLKDARRNTELLNRGGRIDHLGDEQTLLPPWDFREPERRLTLLENLPKIALHKELVDLRIRLSFPIRLDADDQVPRKIRRPLGVWFDKHQFVDIPRNHHSLDGDQGTRAPTIERMIPWFAPHQLTRRSEPLDGLEIVLGLLRPNTLLETDDACGACGKSKYKPQYKTCPTVYEFGSMDHNSFFTSPAYDRLLSEKHMLQLIQYPHPTLRFPSKPLSRVDEALREIIDQMFEIMYEHRGVGLAANQVNLPLRLFIANPTGEKESGQELVFLNPVIQKATGTIEAEEGCLSLPGLHGLVKRNKAVQVNAYSMDGKEINLKVEGFLARIIQHEVDHLDGVLFIDRLFDQGPKVAEEISRFEARFAKQREEGHITDDQKLAEQRQDWLDKYCK